MADASPHKMPEAHQHTLGHYLTLGLLETFFNGLLAIDPASLSALATHAGTVIKLKIRDPYQVLYLLIDSDGIEVRDEYPGRADIRINCTLYALGRCLLGMSLPEGQWKVWGPPEKIAALSDIAQSYELRTSARLWLRQHVNLSEILQKIRQQDSSWLRDLTPMPGLLRDTLQQMRQTNTLIERQQALMAEQMQLFRRDRRDDTLLVVLVLMMMALSRWPQAQAAEPIADVLLLLLPLYLLLLRWRH